MCSRCEREADKIFKLKTEKTLECSWCDAKFEVCEVAELLIEKKKFKYRLCGKCLQSALSGRPSDSSIPRRGDSFESSGPWQDNAIRNLEGD